MRGATNIYVAVCMFIAAAALAGLAILKRGGLPFTLVAILATGTAIVLASTAKHRGL